MSVLSIVLQSLLALYYVFSGIAKIAGADMQTICYSGTIYRFIYLLIH